MIALASMMLAGCLAAAPGSDFIRAADLTPAYAALAALHADTVIAPAPLPGIARVFHPAELQRLAARYGLEDAPERDVCIEVPVAPLEPQRLLFAMHSAFPEAQIELVDFSRRPAPGGLVEFLQKGLHASPQPSPAGDLWTGCIRYGRTRRFPIWARVKITMPVTRVVAKIDLVPGKAIAPGDVELTTRNEAPGLAQLLPIASSLDEVIGKCPRQPVPAGSPVRLAWLDAPKAVLRGETVKVMVRDGGAQLELEAIAESAGAVGESVFVRNPGSHRRFTARVEARGRVVVDPVGVNP